eukprot:m.4110 g.4110  ORF g.4110 m.4110 type:complete len:232 (+) comp3809_c0_seq1:130-825(+)
MSLVYALVAKENQILAEYTASSGNFTTITQAILDKIPEKNQKCSYIYDSFLFHYVREGGIVYLCMADESFHRRHAFSFLAQIKQDFEPFKSRAQHSIAYALNREFSPILKREMGKYNAQRQNDQLAVAQREVQEVKNVMIENIDKVLERSEKIDLLVDKAEDLKDGANRFQKKSTHLRKQMWWQNKKMTLLLVAVILVIALIIGISVASKVKKHNPTTTTTTHAPTTTTSP